MYTGISTVVLMLTYLTASRLHKIITKPIDELSEFTNTVLTEKMYNLRKEKIQQDEIGNLIDAINRCLDHIQATENILQDKANAKQPEQLKELKDKIETAHLAGKANIASSVLHNVGNVLNSISVTTGSLKERNHDSKAVNLAKAVDILEEHKDNLSDFLNNTDQGQKLLVYLGKLANYLCEEQQNTKHMLNELTDHVQHITDIISIQQSHSKASGLSEIVNIQDLVEDAIRINQNAIKNHDIVLVRDFDDIDEIALDRHKVMQIIINLISNAKDSLKLCNQSHRQIDLRIKISLNNSIIVEVEDNGSGISKGNMGNIFKHGFTTKEDGHGFGLHSSSISAGEMGGSLHCHSNGSGKGAIFTLELPYKTTPVKQGYHDDRSTEK